MGASFTLTLTRLELVMTLLAIDNMKHDEEVATRRAALLRAHAKIAALLQEAPS